jgi:predicted nucleotidyltransferase
MNRDTVLKKLHEHRAEMSTRFGAKRIALFGSAARDELSHDSDVDVLVDFDPSPTLERYLDLQGYLEHLMGRRVDLVTRSGLKPRAWQTVRRDLIDVP